MGCLDGRKKFRLVVVLERQAAVGRPHPALGGGTVPEVRPEAGKEVLGAAHLPGEPRAGVVSSRAATRRGIFGSRCQVKATVPVRHRLSRAHESWLLSSDRT